MSVVDVPELADSWERAVVRLLQLGLFGLMVYGLATFRLGMAANGAISLSVTLLPAIVRREYDYVMDAGLVLWITAAVVLHVVGSLGLYTQFSWYDEITHTLSATVVAGIGYAALRTVERHSAEVNVPSAFRGLFIVVFVLAFGMLWEVFEFSAVEVSKTLGVSSPVIVFGIDDIVTDLVFNTVGAVVVALWGTQHFGGLARFLSARFGRDGRD